MEPKNEHTSSPQPAEGPAAPKKRFRIEKLEERIAPRCEKQHGYSYPGHSGSGGSSGGYDYCTMVGGY